MKQFFKKILYWYQHIFSPDTGLLVKMGIKRPTTCTFYPSCSEYTKQAISSYGVIRGLWKGGKRIIRCHPWQKNHIDPLV